VLFAEALRESFGTHGDLDAYDFSGKTDGQIVRELMRGAGFADEHILATLPRMRDAYLEKIETRLGAVEVIAGVHEALAALAQRDDVCVALLTGNWRRGAAAKLGRADLVGRFAWEIGAFADDGEDRACLPPVALERARRQTGRSFAAADALIIGDSVEDVRCARACGVPMLAVASGWTSEERLRAAGAERVVPRLDAAFDLLLG